MLANRITPRVAGETVHHEAIVQEAYKDSQGIWTWSIGITDASGFGVQGYKDNPQSIHDCLGVFVHFLRDHYAPAVDAAFDGHQLTEEQFAAALSFHYNTGAIGRADWVTSFKAGKLAKAKLEFMNWKSPPEIIPRREAERDLFFNGVWSQDGLATVYPVRKPSYHPDFAHPTRVDISAELAALLA